MYIAIAVLAAIFAVSPAKTEKNTPVPLPQRQATPAAPAAAPVLIDSRFSRKAAPWEKTADPAEFIPSAKTC